MGDGFRAWRLPVASLGPEQGFKHRGCLWPRQAGDWFRLFEFICLPVRLRLNRAGPAGAPALHPRALG